LSCISPICAWRWLIFRSLFFKMGSHTVRTRSSEKWFQHSRLQHWRGFTYSSYVMTMQYCTVIILHILKHTATVYPFQIEFSLSCNGSLKHLAFLGALFSFWKDRGPPSRLWLYVRLTRVKMRDVKKDRILRKWRWKEVMWMYYHVKQKACD